ncbi:MAG: hypothetical protein HY437_00300 [Candidatus Magasanikbacteria bacterium]|nr:hypothetical protein [Candidatus Magasanikbacteria bacterium]
MTVAQLLKKKSIQKVGGTPMVMVPLPVWYELEELIEDWEMAHSETLQKRIAASKKSKRLYSAAEVKKILGL